MITRSIGKVIRGKATPLQLALACILGGMLGFLPGYADGSVITDSPGLLLTLLALLTVLNANLALAGLVGIIAKLASLALMPISFEIGYRLLEGPAKPIFVKAINAPVLALFGFERYAVTGGLVLGLLFGIAAAILAVYAITTFRRRMSRIEEGSEAYKKYASKGYVKALTWIFFGGGKGKKTYAQLLEKKMGNPIRVVGVLAVILAAGLLFIVQAFFKDEIVSTMVRRSLERANGATVDMDRASLDLKSGRLLITNLAVADPEKLETDLFRAGTLEATISTKDLLRKRIAIDQLTSADASTGEKRARRGFLIRPRPKPPAPPPQQKTIDDYMKEAKVWKDRLAQAQEWLDEIDRQREESQPAEPGQPQETLRDRLRREAREQGWARVIAWHLIEKSPTLIIRAADLEGVRTQPLPGTNQPEVLDIRARNISTQPWLVDDAPQIKITSRGSTLDLDANLGGLAAARGQSTIALAYRNLPADLIGDQLKVAGDGVRPLQGGTMDVTANGTFGGGIIDLPLQVLLNNTTMSLPGAGSQMLTQLPLTVGVKGALANPAILFDQKAFADALAKAGATELAARARGEATKVAEKAAHQALEKVAPKLDSKLDGLTGDLKSKLPGGLLPKR